MINPLRAAGVVLSLALDAHAALCGVLSDHVSDDGYPEALADREAEEEVGEPSAFDRYASHVPEQPLFECAESSCTCHDDPRYGKPPEWAQRYVDGLTGAGPTLERPDITYRAPDSVECPGCGAHFKLYVDFFGTKK